MFIYAKNFILIFTFQAIHDSKFSSNKRANRQKDDETKENGRQKGDDTCSVRHFRGRAVIGQQK